MSGREARIWPVTDGLWRGEVIASVDGVKIDVRWHGRPFVAPEANRHVKHYTAEQAEQLVKNFEVAIEILHEAAATAKRLGGK